MWMDRTVFDVEQLFREIRLICFAPNGRMRIRYQYSWSGQKPKKEATAAKYVMKSEFSFAVHNCTDLDQLRFSFPCSKY